VARYTIFKSFEIGSDIDISKKVKSFPEFIFAKMNSQARAFRSIRILSVGRIATKRLL
jgi:hypothetical protein